MSRCGDLETFSSDTLTYLCAQRGVQGLSCLSPFSSATAGKCASVQLLDRASLTVGQVMPVLCLLRFPLEEPFPELSGNSGRRRVVASRSTGMPCVPECIGASLLDDTVFSLCVRLEAPRQILICSANLPSLRWLLYLLFSVLTLC